MEQQETSIESTNEAPVKSRRTRKTTGTKAVKKSAGKTKKATTKKSAGKTKKAKAKAVTGNLIQADLGGYTRGEGVTAGGNQTLDIGDTVANKLRGKDIEACYSIAAKAVGETVKALKDRYGHLNLGMQRMNLGNRMRGAAK